MNRFKILLLIFTPFCLFLPTFLSAQMTWTCACSSAQCLMRGQHSSVVFDNKMWVMGGFTGRRIALHDVWYSTDGINWNQATASAGWLARDGHTSVVFDNKIWVIGGGYGVFNPIFMNDVWYSTDGINWNQATANAQWSGRENHTSVVFDKKIWVMGGYNGAHMNDVWFSTDGINWTQATASAGWSVRNGHTSIVFDNKIWVIGGGHDVWFSTDGINWTQATASAEWSARTEHTSVVFDNKMWVIGGYVYSGNSGNKNDVWYSTDGITWTQACSSAQWSARAYHTSLIFDNKMWVMGWINDVWYSTGLGIEEHLKSYVQGVIPNPTIVRGVLNLQSSIYNLKSEIFLLDITGRKVADLKSGANNIRHLAQGVYFIRSKNNNQVTKIILTR